MTCITGGCSRNRQNIACKISCTFSACPVRTDPVYPRFTRPLEEPFFVIATQNPLETLGTFPLPEAQMDRFFMKIRMENLSAHQELSMAERFLVDEPFARLESICEKDELTTLCSQCREIYIHKDLLKYIIEIVHATRKHPKIMQGVSPRGTLAFVRAAQAFAMTEGRNYIVPEDVKSIAVPVLSHRLTLSVPAENVKYEETIIQEILNTVKVPVEEWEKR